MHLLFCSAGAILAGCASTAPIHPDIPSPGYTLAWHDEFDGTKLDATKWAQYAPGPRRDAVNVPEAVTLDGQGHLVITTSRVRVPDAAGATKTEYRTGMITTRGLYETTYGYFEARIKFQREVGHWSAFWIQTPTMGQPLGDPATAGVEIDIIEYLRNGRYPDKAQHTIHWDAYTKDHKSDHAEPSIPAIAEGFHTYGCEWTPEVLIFYVDGRETWRTSKAVPRRDEFMILSLEVGKWADDITKAELPDSMVVDWVRVWKKESDSPGALLGVWSTGPIKSELGMVTLEFAFDANTVKIAFKPIEPNQGSGFHHLAPYRVEGHRIVSEAIHDGQPVAYRIDGNTLHLDSPDEPMTLYRK